MKQVDIDSGPKLSRQQRLLRQEFGHLATRIIHEVPKSRLGTRRIGFCAGNRGEGCTSVALNYASFSGQQGVRTTLVETSMRRPTLARSFAVDDVPGLWGLLHGDASANDIVRRDVAEGVDLVPAGTAPRDPVLPGDAWDLLGLFEFLESGSELIVVDLPALTTSPEATLVLPQLDGVVLVVEANRSRQSTVERNLRQIRELGVKVVGCVMNRMRYEMPSFVDRMI